MENLRLKSRTKIAIFFLLISFCSLLSAVADDFTVEGAEPYDQKATPQWVKDMRRGEIITLGSWPFTLLVTAFGFSFGEFVAHGFDSSYLKNPFALSGDDYSISETKKIIFTSLGISVAIGVADLIVRLVKRKKARENNAIQFENVTIVPLGGGGQQDKNFIFNAQNSEILFGNLESAVF